MHIVLVTRYFYDWTALFVLRVTTLLSVSLASRVSSVHPPRNNLICQEVAIDEHVEEDIIFMAPQPMGNKMFPNSDLEPDDE